MKVPEGFVESIAVVGTPVLDGLVDVLENSVPSVAVRDNVGKRFRYPGGDGDVPWCAAGHYLDNRPSFTLDPAFHQGMYCVISRERDRYGILMRVPRPVVRRRRRLTRFPTGRSLSPMNMSLRVRPFFVRM